MNNYITLFSFILLLHCGLNVIGQKNLDGELPPPNILWISWEDCGPQFGSYGDMYSDTPNIDQLASKGSVYTRAYANYPVCAPARATIISGMYPNSFGAQHMQCRTIPEEEVRLFPQFLRKAGYFCTNDAKDHYQMEYDQDLVWDRMGACEWDENGYHSFWQERPHNKPFFSVVNFFQTHEGNSRTNKKGKLEEMKGVLGKRKHDPAKAPIPPYYPDNQVVRENIALYYDNLTFTDSLVGVILNQLEEEGLSDNTIIFFWGDHGWGLPRGKRWPYESGLRVPLIIHVPEKYQNLAGKRYQPGQRTDELVSFVDLAPTILSLAGVEVPDYMHGKPFLGPQASAPNNIIFGGRDRMDETTDIMRFAMDKNYLYIRNYHHQLPYVQTLRTIETVPIMQEMRRYHQEDKLNATQALFFQPEKPVEELYDLRNDPHQINNLAGKSAHKDKLLELREKHKQWMLEIGEIGLIPESELDLIKWPDSRWNKTQTPYFESEFRSYWNGDMEVQIKSPTTGAEVVWKYDDDKYWKIYEKPIIAQTDKTLLAKASRLGFYTSDVVAFDPSNVNDKPVTNNTYKYWRSEVEEDLLSSLLKLKELDFKKNSSLQDYISYLKADHAAIKYWAVDGILHATKTKQDAKQTLEALRPLLKDPSPTVRVQVATAFCKWGNFEDGQPILQEALNHTHESVRLFTLNSIESLGQEAARFLPFPYIPPGTANHYSHRVMLKIYKKLKYDLSKLETVDASHFNEIMGVYNTIILVEEI